MYFCVHSSWFIREATDEQLLQSLNIHNQFTTNKWLYNFTQVSTGAWWRWIKYEHGLFNLNVGWGEVPAIHKHLVTVCNLWLCLFNVLNLKTLLPWRKRCTRSLSTYHCAIIYWRIGGAIWWIYNQQHTLKLKSYMCSTYCTSYIVYTAYINISNKNILILT